MSSSFESGTILCIVIAYFWLWKNFDHENITGLMSNIRGEKRRTLKGGNILSEGIKQTNKKARIILLLQPAKKAKL